MPGRRENDIIKGLFCPKCGSETVAKGTDVAQSGKPRYRCKNCGSRTTTPFKVKPQIFPKFKKTKSKNYIITSVMSGAKLNEPYWKTLQNLAKMTDARIIVVGTVETNPNLYKRSAPLFFHEETLPYLCMEKFRVNKNLVVRGDYSIEHAVVNPLSGANHQGGIDSEIFGHAQMAMEVIPTPKDEVPKVMYTTGTVSEPHYKKSARAKKAEFHHSFNALFVEVKGAKFWPTQLPWDGEGVQLYDRYYTATTSRRAPKLAGVVYGDSHWDMQTKKEKENTLLLHNGLNAAKNLLCDVLDFHTGSHHRNGKVIENLRNTDYDIRGELDRAVDYIKSVPNCVIVASNHNDHLDQWFNAFDPRRRDPNLSLYADLMEMVRREDTGLFELYCRDKGVTCDFTSRNKAYDVAGIDCSQHADKGPNGARGSIKGFAKTGRKTMMGHPHTPAIHKGAWGVGTSAMHMSYAQGYSSWLVAHGFIQAGGKRTMNFIIDNQIAPMLKEALDNDRFQ